jgi:hypothetical protein
VVNKIQERCFRTLGNTRSMYVGFKDMILFGTSVIAPCWAYQEGFRYVMTVGVDPFTGAETSSVTLENVAMRDDCELMALDNDEFFPDPGQETTQRMLYAGRRFIIPQFEAQEHIETGRWRKAATTRALEYGPKHLKERWSDDYRSGLDRPMFNEMPEAYKPGIAYEVWARVPYKTADGVPNRRITVFNGQLVESIPAPYLFDCNVPFCELTLNPIKGRFRGLGPGTLAKYTQDFTDALLVCLARSVVRKTDPPVLYSHGADLDLGQLAAWVGPIGVNDPAMVREIAYTPALQEAFMLLAGMKDQSRAQSSAMSGMQGFGLGSKRFSATESQATFAAQADRPTMMAQLLEREYLPQIAKANLRLYQRYVSTTEELQRRVGTDLKGADAVSLSHIAGDYDIRFVGSSMADSKQAKMQFIERVFQIVGSIPGAAPNFPWNEAMMQWLALANMRDLEAMVGDPNAAADFVERSMLMGPQKGQGNGNGTSPAMAPAGMMPQQAMGETLQ